MIFNITIDVQDDEKLIGVVVLQQSKTKRDRMQLRVMSTDSGLSHRTILDYVKSLASRFTLTDDPGPVSG